ncbi:efflux RND transporter permease subunit [Alteromonas gilva]|uniref:MMPL family transporter n=1 Tax=Alteromonas gilva TaxID=2987522 RepID=A0ABT5L6L0_9ALTE|nr:MMPL family transporter [Alteromonas gilva]MDC8832011.1 MMPL family transporter [Alteromonas gilva]
MNRIANKLVEISSRKPRWVYAALLLLTLGVGSQIPRITIDTDPENMLAESHPARTFHNATKTQFAMHDAIVVGVVNDEHSQGIYNRSSLTDIYNLTRSIQAIDGVINADLMSVSTVDNITQAAPGTLRFEWMMPQAPQSETAAQQIQTDIERLPLLYDTLVSQNGKAAAIYVPIEDKNESYRIAEQIRAAMDKYDGTEQWYITGLPVAEDQFGVEMFVQMGVSAPLAGLTIFILLFVFFRNIPLIIAPMVVAMATVIVTMGLLIGFGFTVHIMSSMIAIFLMPIAVVDSVHILSEFADRYKPGEDLNVVVKDVVGQLFTPMLYTSITSSVGFFSLMLTPIPPVQIFGAFVGFGILFAFIVTIVFMPAYLTRMSDQALANLQQAMHQGVSARGTRIGRVARSIGNIATGYPRTLLVGFGVIFALSIWGITQIQINDNPVRWFKSDHEIRVADRVLNHHFAGTYNAYLVLTDKREQQTPANLLAVDAMPESLRDWRQQTLADISAGNHAEQLQNLIFAIDDKLFGDVTASETAYLEAVMAMTETADSQGKTFQNPQVLAYIAGLQSHLGASGLVGKSNALPDVVKVVNRELHSGKANDYELPDTASGVAQTLLQYQSSHRPNDLWHFVTPDYRSSLIWLQLTSGDNQDMSAVVSLVRDYISANPLPEGLTADWAGKAYLNVVWQDNMVAGMIDSLIGAFIIVFVMMIILFRSLVYGVLAMLPLTLTITFIYGLIGLVGKDYDMPIAVLSALTLGLSVDFAIHFLERARATYQQTNSVKQTMAMMFAGPASAITRNALVIALGFTPLLFAPLVPYITVGVFLASIMAISALVTLLMLPAAMSAIRSIVFKPAN